MPEGKKTGEATQGWLESRAARRAAADHAPQQTGTHYRDLFHFASDPIYCVDADTLCFVDLNQTALDTLGYERHELLGKSVRMLDAGSTDAQIARYVQQLEDEGHGILRTQHRRRDGSVFAVEVHSQRRLLMGHPVYDCIARDLTERQGLEEACRSAEAAFEIASRMAKVGAWTLDLRTGEPFFSDEVCRIYGVPEGTALHAEEGILYYPPDVRPTITAAVELAIAEGVPYDLEIAFVNHSGERRWVRTLGKAHYDEAGRPMRLVGAMQDITGPHVATLVSQARGEIRVKAGTLTAEDDMSSVIEAFCAALTTLRIPARHCHFSISSPQAERHLEYDHSHGTGWRRVRAYTEERNAAAVVAGALQPPTSQVVSQSQREIRCTCGPVHVLLQADEAAQLDALDATSVEQLLQEVAEAQGRLNERRAAHARELQLQQAQRLEAIGRLAGGIAHDFNNLIAVIMGTCDMTRGLDDHLTADDAATIAQAARSARDLTQQLLAFSRQQVLQPRTVSLNETVQRLARMLERVLGERVKLELQTHASPDTVFVDPGQIDQVVMNLAVNARDAMADGGTLTLKTSDVVWTWESEGRPPQAEPGSYVRLSVTDTGEGIPDDIRAHIFEPFFTTKRTGTGTGLGLATVHGAVTQSQGHIVVRSDPGEGTTFDIYLPLATATARAEQPKKPAPTAAPRTSGHPGGGELVLVVEDQDNVRALICAMLTRAGYTVKALSGLEAVRRALGSELSSVDLAVTDVVLEDGSGADVAKLLHEQVGPVPVIFMSGYAEHDLIDDAMVVADSAFIQKPFDRSTMLELVRDLLRSSTEVEARA